MASLKHPSGQRGTTLLELVVTMALVSLLLVIAGAMVVAVTTAWERIAADVPAGDVSMALASLENDLLSCTAVPGPPGDWRGDALRLLRTDGSETTWRLLDAGYLERTHRSASGETILRQDLAESVLSWRWRVVAPGVIDVSVRRQGDTTPTGAVRVSLRGAGGGW